MAVPFPIALDMENLSDKLWTAETLKLYSKANRCQDYENVTAKLICMTSLQYLLWTPYYYHSWSKLNRALTPLRSHFRSVNTDDVSHPKALAMANIFWNSAYLSMHSNSEALHFYLKVWGRNAWNRKGLMKNNSLVLMRPIFYLFLQQETEKES